MTDNQILSKPLQSPTIGKIADALSKAQAEMQHAAKTADNPFYKSKYADLPAVIDAARPHLAKNSLSVCQLTEFNESGVTLITQLMHSSGEWLCGYYPVRPIKNDPQGMGSALTYARRYSYQSLVGIATSVDDDDGNAASALTAQEKKSVFKNGALRKEYCNNAITAIEQAETVDELNNVITLYKPKFAEMRDGGNEYDCMAVDDLNNKYKVRLASLKNADESKKMDDEFRNKVG